MAYCDVFARNSPDSTVFFDFAGYHMSADIVFAVNNRL